MSPIDETVPVPKKHPCSDCSCCQWCSDERCRVCLGRDGCRLRKKRSIAEQIALYDSLNQSLDDIK
ncbi:MAG: hypothetical protein PHP95_02975 [Desulfuromonadaceae bacterium]|nr:hypothetical protein [Desulfuromonadaceae bacterium]MDD2847397.1 hypothetical protein [Desulfuromonadaceae bacterium]MDD4131490.1 hypothetical protein [Desulfuromonadaceae bacterium]